MKRILVAIAVLLLPYLALAQELRIAVAANAQFVAKVLAADFKKQSGISPELVVGASGKLTTQIEQGAPFDVFLSADMKYPQELYSKGLTTAKPKEYAYGKLVLWTMKSAHLNNGLAGLKSAEFKKVAVANPKLAPYGEAAIQAFNKLKIYTALQPKIVYGESIAQVNQYLLTGAADAALTAKAVVLDPEQADKGRWVDVPQGLYKPIAQGVIVVKTSNHKKQAQQFYTYLFSNKAQKIFKQYGYQ